MLSPNTYAYYLELRKLVTKVVKELHTNVGCHFVALLLGAVLQFIVHHFVSEKKNPEKMLKFI